MEKEIKIIRTYKENGKEEEITIEEAIEKLEGYWNTDDIKPMIENGDTLFTPFALYKIKQ